MNMAVVLLNRYLDIVDGMDEGTTTFSETDGFENTDIP